jgi:hypothetical protein
MFALLLLVFVVSNQAIDLDNWPPIELQFYPVHPKAPNGGKFSNKILNLFTSIKESYARYDQVTNITVGTPGSFSSNQF